MAASQLTAYDYLARINAVYLEDRLRNIQTDFEIDCIGCSSESCEPQNACPWRNDKGQRRDWV